MNRGKVSFEIFMHSKDLVTLNEEQIYGIMCTQMKTSLTFLNILL